MQLKNNVQFPYPVILNEKKYYKNSTINIKLLNKVTTDAINVNYIFEVNSTFINYLLEENLCSAYLIVDSEFSMYRNVFKIPKANVENVIELKSSELQNKMTITPIVVLNTDFDTFTSEEFKKSKVQYSAKKNDIIGFIEPFEFYLDNVENIFPSIASVITIRNTKDDKEYLTYRLENEMISLFISDQKTYQKLQEINLRGEFNFTLYQAIVLPVLVDALLNIDKKEYENYRWSRLIKNKINYEKKKMPTTYNEAYILAQFLLKNPIKQSIEELHNSGGDDE